MMLTRKLRPIVWCAFGILAFSSCRQEEAEPRHPVLSTDYRLTSVVMLDEPGSAQSPLPFWRAEYYPDGSLKSLSDDRDSSYVAYAYAGREIIGKDISTHNHWAPFTAYRLALDDRQRVVQSYWLSGRDHHGTTWSDTTTYATNQDGYLVEQVQKTFYRDGRGAVSVATTTITHQLSGGDPVLTTVTTESRPSTGPSNRRIFRFIREYYLDKPDKNNIGAFFPVYGSFRFHGYAPRHDPFFKPAAHLLKKVTYLDQDGNTTSEREFFYEWDSQGNVTRITGKDPGSTTGGYGLRYNGQ
jgi:hypothetical protein